MSILLISPEVKTPQKEKQSKNVFFAEEVEATAAGSSIFHLAPLFFLATLLVLEFLSTVSTNLCLSVSLFSLFLFVQVTSQENSESWLSLYF